MVLDTFLSVQLASYLTRKLKLNMYISQYDSVLCYDHNLYIVPAL